MKREGVVVLFSGKGQDGAGLPVRSAIAVGSRAVWGSACAGIG